METTREAIAFTFNQEGIEIILWRNPNGTLQCDFPDNTTRMVECERAGFLHCELNLRSDLEVMFLHHDECIINNLSTNVISCCQIGSGRLITQPRCRFREFHVWINDLGQKCIDVHGYLLDFKPYVTVRFISATPYGLLPSGKIEIISDADWQKMQGK